MIAKLSGLVAYIETQSLVLDVHGVGYLVFCPSSVLANVQPKQAFSLYTEMLIKDEHITLFGFTTLEQKQWFKLLTSVQGVGGKMAIAVLGALTTDKLFTAIAAQDNKAFQQISGIGPKLAARIVNELKDKAVANVNSVSHDAKQVGSIAPQGLLADVVSALVNLGFGRSDAFSVANEILVENAEMDFNSLLKRCLAELGR